MLQQSINFFKQTEKTQTTATNTNANNTHHKFAAEGTKIFTAADLWNIQRRAKAIMPRRSFF